MAWCELTSEFYQSLFKQSLAPFLRADFNLMNAYKVDAIRFYAYKNEKLNNYSLGIIFGEKSNEWSSPFSAPFGGFSYNNNESFSVLLLAIKELRELALENKKNVKIIIPPIFYDRHFLSKVVVSFLQNGFKESYANINYAFDFTDLSSYEERLHFMGKRNLKQVLKSNYSFKKVTSIENCKIVYDIIEKHYQKKNYPLWMSFENLLETSKKIPIDFNLLYLDNKPIASTIVYKISKKIAQMIYWGSYPEYWEKRPLNAIAQKMFLEYQKMNFNFLDIGPSASNGIVSEGLSLFKESVGCFADIKYAFEFDGTIGS